MNEEKRNGKFMQVYNGQKFWPLDPREDEIFITDIAHALSNQCRFAGHCEFFYSVAQHSVLASQICKPDYALDALLHDASEAYLIDIPRPIKSSMPEYLEIEDKLMTLISKKYGTQWPLVQDVKNADVEMLANEKQQIMKNTIEWSEDIIPQTYTFIKIESMIPRDAEQLFIKRYFNLSLGLLGLK